MDNNYIELLKWGRENTGINREALQAKLKELGLPSEIVGYDGRNNSLNAFTDGIFCFHLGKYFLKHEGFFELHEHERLEDARKSSRNAMWIAIGAMLISAFVGLWQIMLMYYSSDVI